MRLAVGILSAMGITAAGLAAFHPLDPVIIWNRTESAPQGLYWLSDDPFTKGRWVVVSARSDIAQWAQNRGYVGDNWPLIKQISGVEGDEICRRQRSVFVNGAHVGTAKLREAQGRLLPAWKGCRALGRGEVFLLNAHPDSLDGRYFGATRLTDLQASATLIWKFGS